MAEQMQIVGDNRSTAPSDTTNLDDRHPRREAGGDEGDGPSAPDPAGDADRGRRRGEPPPPPDDPGDDDAPKFTSVKISSREADKIVVPPCLIVRYLDDWMTQANANVLSACEDTSQEKWIALFATFYSFQTQS